MRGSLRTGRHTTSFVQKSLVDDGNTYWQTGTYGQEVRFREMKVDTRGSTSMAHKKGQGSSRNGRESNAQMLGVKVFGGAFVTTGSIIVRQRGTALPARPQRRPRPGRHALRPFRWRGEVRPRRPARQCRGAGIVVRRNENLLSQKSLKRQRRKQFPSLALQACVLSARSRILRLHETRLPELFLFLNDDAGRDHQ